MDCVRLSWDDVGDETAVMDAIACLREAGFGWRRIKVYVLIGYEDTPDDAYYRLQTLKDLGIRPNAQRYQSATTTKMNADCGIHWTRPELARYMRYWNRQAWLGGVPFENYR